MTLNKKLSSQADGASNVDGTETRPVSPFISAEKSSTSAMSATTQSLKPNFQVTLPSSGSQVDDQPHVTEARMLWAFALNLFKAKLVILRKVTLGGQVYFALLFPTDAWQVVGKELLPVRKDENHA